MSEIEKFGRIIDRAKIATIVAVVAIIVALVVLYFSFQKWRTLQGKIVDLETQSVTLTNSNEELKQENDTLVTNNGTLTTANSELEGKNTQLKGENGTLESEKAQLEKDKNSLQGEKTKLENEKTQLQKDLAEARKEITKIKGNPPLQQLYDEAVKERDVVKQKLTKANEDLIIANNKLHQKEQEIKNLQAEINKIIGTTPGTGTSDILTAIKEMLKEIEKYATQIAELQKQRDSALAERDKIQKRLNDCKDDYRKYINAMDDYCKWDKHPDQCEPKLKGPDAY